MTNQDARVAEAVGYTFFRAGDIVSALFTVPPSEDAGYFSTLESVQAKDIDAEDIFAAYRDPPPFISAATAATDQIVLEWVQGQDEETIFDFTNKIRYILDEYIFADEDHPEIIDWFEVWMRHGKPGMYAQALLAIQEERNE